MEKVNSIIGIFENIDKKVKAKMIFGIVLISTAILLFIPENYFDFVTLINTNEDYRMTIGICFIVSISYFVYRIFNKIATVVGNVFYRNGMYKYLKKDASDDERSVLYEYFYNEEEHRFNITGVIPWNLGVHIPLEFKKIIYVSSNTSQGTIHFPYNLQPFIYKRLNKDLNSGKVYVENEMIHFKK